MKRHVILAILLLTACTQEISSNTQMPAVTSAYIPSATPTETPTPTPVPFTPTPASFPLPEPLPAGPVSMIAIGDSLTQGVGDDTGRGYPGRLLELVNQIRPSSSIANFGQAGWDSSSVIHGDGGQPGELPRALTEIQNAHAQQRNAVAFVWIGFNDLWYLYENGTVTDAQELQNAQEFEANMTEILIQLRSVNVPVIVALLNDPSKLPVASGETTLPALESSDLEKLSLQVQRYNSIIEKKANQYGALTVDFYNTDIFTATTTLANDGIHPNDSGYDLITQAWYKQLITILP